VRLDSGVAMDAIVPVAAEIGGPVARLRSGSAGALPAAREPERNVRSPDLGDHHRHVISLDDTAATIATGLTEVLGVVLVEQLIAVGIGGLKRAHERRLNR
jgi:hypothetical protein